VNAARLTRRWQEPAGDPARMAEALVDEINDPATGLVTRDFLRAELAQIRQETPQLRQELTQQADTRKPWAAGASSIRHSDILIWAAFVVQIVVVVVMTMILFQVLR